MPSQPDTAASLQAIAARVCWWQPPGETLADQSVFLCRVMALGTWDDAAFCLEYFGAAAFRSALQAAPPGILDIRSWHYWHHRFEMLPVPPMPVRAIPA